MMKIHHLNCVEIHSPGYGRAIGHCLLLETDQKLILIDAGIGLIDTQKPFARIGKQLIDIVGYKFNEEWTAIKRIEKLGFNPAKVTDCIISHLDNDHIGGLADFPSAKVHLGIEEYENVNNGNSRYLSQPLEHNPMINTYSKSSEAWFDFEARKVDLGSEIELYLIPLFGHTLGHCGVALKHQSQWLFYVGDAYYLRAELTDINHPVSELATMRADDNELRIATLNKIRNFIAKHREVEVFGYHDIHEFTTSMMDKIQEKV